MTKMSQWDLNKGQNTKTLNFSVWENVSLVCDSIVNQSGKVDL